MWKVIYTTLFSLTLLSCAYINGQTSQRVKLHDRDKQIAILHGDWEVALAESQSFNPSPLPQKKQSRWDAVTE